MSEMAPEPPEPLGDIPIVVDSGACRCIHVLRRVSPTSWRGATRITDPDCEVHR